MTMQDTVTPRAKPGPKPRVRTEEVRAEPVRESVRPEAEGEGTVLRPTRTSRTRPGHQDQLHIPDDILAQFPDCDFQWVIDSCLGKPMVQDRMGFEMNGWEPVPAKLFDGRFMPRGFEGEINVGGLVLMWRRLELTIEARKEDRLAAQRAVGVHEAKMRAGQIDGVTMATDVPNVRAVTRLTKEIIPGMAVPK